MLGSHVDPSALDAVLAPPPAPRTKLKAKARLDLARRRHSMPSPPLLALPFPPAAPLSSYNFAPPLFERAEVLRVQLGLGQTLVILDIVAQAKRELGLSAETD